MKIGQELIWDTGLDSVRQTGRSYFIANMNGNLYFAIFTALDNVWDVDIYNLLEKDFVELKKRGIVKTIEREKILPPWFPVEADYSWAYERIKRYKNSSEIARSRIRKIQAAYDASASWISEDFKKKLNEYAKESKCNTKRFRLWVLTYLIFGPEECVLAPKNWLNGQYNRDGSTQKLGRPSTAGNHFNHKLTAEDKGIFKLAYSKYKGPKISLVRIYDDMLIFLYKVREKDIYKHKSGAKVIRIDGHKTVPSIHQFRYWVDKNIGKNQVYKHRFGSEKARNKIQRNMGSYSQDSMNLMGVVERDAYVHEEIPKGITEKMLPKLWVVHLVCRLSGLIVGIGFSHGGEKAEAYRMAEFCAAIDKREFCRLMGLTQFDPDSWPSIGISPETVTDRGPGAGVNIGSVFANLTASYSPQSKPIVEASNPKKDKISGGVVHKRSNMTPIELMRHAVREVLVANDSKNVVAKFPNRFLEEDLLCTPATLWKKFETVGRNCAMQISYQTAIRTYLNKGAATIGEMGLYFGGQLYFTKELNDLLTKRSRKSEILIYYMPMNVRQIWAEIDSELLELSAVMKILDDDQQLHITYEELSAYSTLRNASNAIGRAHKAAVNVERNAATFSETGRSVNNRSINRGKPKNKSISARNEMRKLAGGRSC